MNKYLTYFFAFIITFTASCKKEATPEVKVFVISKQDSINKSYNPNSNDIPPPQPPPQELKWYSSIVFIIDSRNKVYLYQTESSNKYGNTDLIYEYEYPNYIGLKPEYLITFENDQLIPFLKANNDIFKLIGNTENHTNRFFYIASDADTIKNPALVNLENYLAKEERVNYLIRRTTEEENIILNYKRNKVNFLPENINWTNKFINGKVTPFTPEYKKLELKIQTLRKAKETYKVANQEIRLL